MCYKCGEKGRYASQCRMEQELTCYKCGENDHRASECHSKVDKPTTCTFFEFISYTVENCFVTRSNEAVENNIRGSPRTVSPWKPKELGHQGGIISCS